MEQMTVTIDGVTYNHTHDSLIALIKEVHESKEYVSSIRTEVVELERRIRTLRQDIREFFESKMDTGADDILCPLEDVNEFLISIGADPFNKSWSATVTIVATVTGVEAASADEVKELISDNIEINLNTDGDIWTDDVNVSSVYPEA